MSTKSIRVSDTTTLPTDVVTMATAALGIRGSGKTNTGVVVAEGLLHAGHQVIVIDPLDVWYGLRSSADGTKDGYPVTVIGGYHGDIPLAEGDGKVIADFLVENPVPAILSLRHLSKSAQRRLIADFAEHFYHRKGEEGRSTPVLCIVDEASLFVPQFVKGESARMVGAIESWVRQGRVSGIGVMLIDQRAASVNKDVLSQVELMIAHRHTSPQDRKALQLWVQAHATPEEEKTFMDSLASLGKGEAWFWSPEWLKLFKRVQVRPRQTFDSSATPGQGKPAPTPKRLAPVELEGLKKKLAATIEKARAEDPRELKRQIAELQKQLAAKPAAPAPAAEVKRVEVPVVKAAEAQRLEREVASLAKRADDLVGAGMNLGQVAKDLGEALARARRENEPTAPVKPAFTLRSSHDGHTAPRPTPNTPTPRASSNGNASGLSKAERLILTALARNGPATKNKVAVLTGYAVNGGGFNNALSRCRSQGWIGGSGDRIEITQAGADALGPYDPLPTGAALIDHWRRAGARRAGGEPEGADEGRGGRRRGLRGGRRGVQQRPLPPAHAGTDHRSGGVKAQRRAG